MSNVTDQALERVVEKIDEVFDRPLETTNRILNINVDAADPNHSQNIFYERYRSGIHRLEAGVVLGLGGLAAGAAGLETAWVMVNGGFLVGWYGAVKGFWNIKDLGPKPPVS